jgi:hypothetical protein
MQKKTKPFICLLGFLLVFCAVLAWGWINQSASFEELQCWTGKNMDIIHATISAKGWPWWTPSYLFGHSAAFFGISFLPILSQIIAASTLSPFISTVGAYKLTGILTIFLSGVALYSLARCLLQNAYSAAFTALLYATCAQFVLRVAMLEHLTTAACMIFAPLVLLGILRSEKNPAWRSSFLLTLSMAAMAMCYFKIFLLFLPAVSLFCTWRFLNAHTVERKNLILSAVKTALLCIPLVLFPIIPILRESRFLAFFELEPFAAWQQNYSFFSAITWVDWRNWLTSGTAIPSLAGIRHKSLEFYLGPVVLCGILLPLFIARIRPNLNSLPAWSVLKFFTILLILATWLSSGPRSIIDGHFAYLSASMGCSDFTIAILWLVFIAQGILIFLISGKTPIQIGIGILFIGIYYFIPGFKVLEFLPIYRDIRAPSAVWTAFGALSAILASGAGWTLLASIEMEKWKKGLAGAVILSTLILDIGFLHKAFFRPGLPEKTFTDYAEAQKFLATSPLLGRVSALSGRYFYLNTPKDSQRGLSSEAALRHFQLLWIRYMESGSMLSAETAKAYFDLFGISYVLIDRKDPDTPQAYQDGFKQLFPIVFENEGFTILENSTSLYPAYEAKNIVSAENEIFKNPGSVLLLGRGGLITIEGFTGNSVGKIDLQGRQDIPNRVTLEKTSELKKLSLKEPRNTNYHSFTVTGLGTENFPEAIVVSEAYHPDWKAYQGTETLPVYRAVGALMSVQVSNPEDVRFVFTPPWYYNFCATGCLVAWISAGLLFILMRLPFMPNKLRLAWYGKTNQF